MGAHMLGAFGRFSIRLTIAGIGSEWAGGKMLENLGKMEKPPKHLPDNMGAKAVSVGG